MKAIYKREIKSYFSSMVGYAILGFFLLIVGFYFWGINLSSGSSSVGSTLSNIMLVYTVILPILTMRLLAEEQKQKTDQLLFSSPVSIWGIVTGKYLAAVTIFTAPFVVICTMPVVLNLYGNVDFVGNYATIFAFWLLGDVLLAIGLMVSSFTENQIVAAVISFAINITLFLVSSIASILPSTALPSMVGLMVLVLLVGIFLFVYIRNIIVSGVVVFIGEAALLVVYMIKSSLFESAFANVISGISFMSRYTKFASGNFDLGSIFYYVTFIFLFLYLTVQSIQKRRWS
ncbi:MAG: ABC transporter permease subunit [Lachnospiraceae bacterium]|nr:ABC transporter permease subunit [Lachnospiraceae bacterium]